MTLALSTWWYVGWAAAAVVVLIAATLLLAIIGLGRRITRQAEEITSALDGARRGTDELWEVRRTNLLLDRIVHGLKVTRSGSQR